jgi:diguanylate cyclase (GGDEF)-like protein
MDASSQVPRVPVKATLGFEDAPPTLRQRYSALGIAAALVLATSLALRFGNVPGPEIKALIPISVTIWLLADLLTAFLLLAQFAVNGRILIAILVAAYAFSGLLSCTYIASFPGVFRAAVLPLGDQQISVALWLIWHATFPTLVICAALNDSSLARIISRRSIRFVTGAVAAVPVIAATAVSVIVYAYRDSLPHLVTNGHFEPFFRTVSIPSIIFLNLLACIVLFGRRRRFTTLSMWLAVATLSATLDALLNLSSARYTYAWDTGKCIAVVTGCTVLLLMLADVIALYGRLARIARVDALTSLRNRRAFEEHYELVLHNARRLHGSMGLLMIDIDVFKRYNDTYGHLAGDECLRRVALAMAGCAVRPLDLVARYGGEEFVVLLPDTTLEGARLVADRIRSAVERLIIRHGEQALGRTTVSIGIGYVSDARNADETTLFEAADRALYDAKAGGRNRVMLDSIESPAPAPEAAA